MSSENRMTSAPSPQGRRILVALVTGEAGERIQNWRMANDPREAVRLPPHATLCYWAPDASEEEIGRQVHHAFPEPVSVRLGSVRQGDNDQGTLFVELLDQELLTEGLTRLYDGTFVQFPARDDWRWHITCVRDTRGRDVEVLKRSAARLQFDEPWRFTTVCLMQLQGEAYKPLATWVL